MEDDCPHERRVIGSESEVSALDVLQADFNFSEPAQDHEETNRSLASAAPQEPSDSDPEEGIILTRATKRRRYIAIDSEEEEESGDLDLQIVDLCDTDEGDDGSSAPQAHSHPNDPTAGPPPCPHEAMGLSIPPFRPRSAPPKSVDLAESSSSSSSSNSSSSEDYSEDSGFIPIRRPDNPLLPRGFDATTVRGMRGRPAAAAAAIVPGVQAVGPPSSRRVMPASRRQGQGGQLSAGTGASLRRTARDVTSSAILAAPYGTTARQSAPLLRQAQGQSNSKDDKTSSRSKLWPSVSRFHRAVLRWVYCPAQCTIQEDVRSADMMTDLTAVPTEFDTLLDYQKILSRLVLKETLAGLQQGLGPQSTVQVAGEMCSASLVDTKEGVGSLPTDGKLYAVKIRFEVPATPAGTNSRGGTFQQEPQPPFWSGELVGLRSPRWKPSEEAVLGVVQSCDLVNDKHTPKTSPKGGLFVRVLVCASATGGDGDGGRGGWIPLANIQECLGNRKGGGNNVPVSVVGAGSLTTASREFQAIMSISDFPDHVRRCLVDPSVSKEGNNNPIPSSMGASARHAFHCDGGGGGAVGSGRGAELAGRGNTSPPPNVPAKLWQVVVSTFNASQVHAIRNVAEGSSAGFTLLQGPPGTGKTRTIMGIVGVLLAGGCPFPAGAAPSAVARGPAARVTVGSSVSNSTGKGKGKGKGKGVRVAAPNEAENTRLLVVAPSNAAVDELVLRLCQGGVPGSDGNVFFPKVVRVGGPRGEQDGGQDGGGGGGRAGGFRQASSSPIVQAVSLERLAENRRKSLKGSMQMNRLDVLLQAQVVCATLSGSGSQPLVEAILFSAKGGNSAGAKGGKKRKKGKAVDTGGNSRGKGVLSFDAVVMDEAAQAVEPSSLIPLKFNPRTVVLVGDPAQLPATIFSREAKDANYGQSLFQRLQRGGHPKMMLDTQYRMHPTISSFPSDRFYHGLLKSSPTVTDASHGQPFHVLPRFAPYLFHNVAAGRLRRGGAGSAATSLSNPVEVAYITSLLKDLVSSFPTINFNGRVGVIAPYRNQILALRKGMWAAGLRQDGVEISTVDGFQGREKEIMIFSCVRAPEDGPSQDPDNSGGGIGFMGDWRRLNVAITRAKHAMWIVGHAGVLKQSDEWRELINDSRRRGAFIDPSSNPSGNPSGGSKVSKVSTFSSGGRGSTTSGSDGGLPQKGYVRRGSGLTLTLNRTPAKASSTNGSLSADLTGDTWAVPEVNDRSTSSRASGESRFERSNEGHRCNRGQPQGSTANGGNDRARQAGSSDYTRRRAGAPPGPAASQASPASGDYTRRYMCPGQPAPGCGTGGSSVSGHGRGGHQDHFVGGPQQPLLPPSGHLYPPGGHRALVGPPSLPPLPPAPPLPAACGAPFAGSSG